MATLIERHTIDLAELVEELQDELETIDTARRSPLQLSLISQLACEIIEQAQLLRQSVVRLVPGYLDAAH